MSKMWLHRCCLLLMLGLTSVQGWSAQAEATAGDQAAKQTVTGQAATGQAVTGQAVTGQAATEQTVTEQATDANLPTLRPGDSVFLSLPGESSLNNLVQIRRNGYILLPEVGEVSVTGLTLPQATDKIKNLLQEVIHDLTAFELILKNRRLIISVLGYVKSPGTVDLADGATIQEAITAAEGLMPGAQLDKLQVRRDQQVFSFNYKYYLDSGDPSKLPQLQPLDTIFVPASPLMGNVQVDFDASSLLGGDAGDSLLAIKVFGEVTNPGSFSYKKDTSIIDLLMRAGGVSRFANVAKIRILSNGAPVLFNLKKYLDTGDKSTLVEVSPGDTIFVPNIEDEASAVLSAVHIMGEVNRPGRFDFSENMNLFDLITRAGGPNDKANIGRIKVLSYDEQGNISSRLFDMTKFIEQGGLLADIPVLKARDTIVVPTLTVDAADEKTKWLRQASEDSIYLMGEVSAPGRYLFQDNMHFLDILAAAAGPSASADISNIRITHRDGETSRVTHLDLGRYFETGDESLLPRVKTGDVIYLPSKDRLWLNQPVDQTVRVLGAVTSQGRYRYNQSMTLLDLLAEAGGLLSSAELSSIVVVSAACCDKQVTSFDLLEFSKSGDFSELPQLQTGDTVYVLQKDDSTWNRVVSAIQETLSVVSILKIVGA